MSLLPAAMRLPNDITPLGRKVEKPKLVLAVIDHIKEFETLQRPYPDGTYPKPPLGEKPFFGFDYAAGPDVSLIAVYQKMADEVREDVYQQAFHMIPMIAKPTKEKTATEMMLKQRVAEQSMRAQRAPDWIDLDHEVNMAAKRLRVDEAKLVRSVRSAFGGDVRKSQIESAISYVRTLSR